MLTPARAVMIVICLAALVRVWFVAGIPLVITNDGVGYLNWGLLIAQGEAIDLPPFRTPGYPMFLAAIFLAAGVGPFAILVAQNLLAVATCGLVAFSSARLAGPRLALVMGLFLALDPWLLGFSFYALTELFSAFLLVLAGTLLLTASRASLGRAILIGMTLAMLVLVRPAFQVIVPVFVIGWLLSFALRSRSGIVTASAMAVAFLVAVAPWLWHNQQRGITGFSGGSGVFLWLGAQSAGLLDDEYPLPPEIRELYDQHVRPGGAGRYVFFREVRAFHDEDVERALRNWAIASIRQDPGAWLEAFTYALRWQLGYFPRRGPVNHEGTRWLLRRLAQPQESHPSGAVNYAFQAPADMSRFAMYNDPGPQRVYFERLSRWRHLGSFHGVLLVFALAGAILAAARHHWMIAAFLAATIGYYLMHAAFLLPYDRFSMPCWTAWYIAPAALVATLRGRGRAGDEDSACEPLQPQRK